MNRRSFLQRSAFGAASLGVAKTLHNTVIGYGHLGAGKNLLTQDLDAVARRGMPSLAWLEMTVDDVPVRATTDAIRYRDDGRWIAVDDAAPPRVSAFARDVRALRSDAFRFEYVGVDAFFGTLADHEVRPPTVAALRGRSGADPDLVATVTGESPADPRSVLEALVDVFRDRSHYDVPRYLAGSIDDNLLPFDADLREPFVPTIDFARLAEDDGTVGMFCGEYTRLATAALHAVPAAAQSPPLFGVRVRNRRHKHVYNGIGSVVRKDGHLVVPMTFVDFMETTLIDDVRAGRLIDDSLDAYDGRHRADAIRW